MAAGLKADATRYQSGYGLEFWFASPDAHAPPPRWKMAAVTTLALYPVVNLLTIALNPLIGGWSIWTGGLVALPLTIILMTYLVMPAMTRLFSRWLFETTQEATP